MIKQLADHLRPALDFPLIRKTRRNHGLEHATVHILSKQIERLRIAGRSTHNGFMLIGDVPTEKVEEAAKEALDRMRAGEHHLAMHPNCGTNLVATGILTALVGVFGVGMRRRQGVLNHFSWMVTMMMLAALVAQPLGMDLQKHITTEGDPGDLELIRVRRHVFTLPFVGRPITLHNVVTRKG